MIQPQDKTLLLVDDDKPFLTRLARAMETRGFAVRMADTVAEGIAEVKNRKTGARENVPLDQVVGRFGA